MSPVLPGRFTADVDGEFVVFLIGMRVNRFRSFRKWRMVAGAMPPMMRRLATDPDSGCLGTETFFRFGPLTTITVSYWASFEHLERFAEPGGAAPRPVARLQPDDRERRERRHLARDLPRAGGRLRGALRQHAALRTRPGRPARPRRRPAGDGAAAARRRRRPRRPEPAAAGLSSERGDAREEQSEPRREQTRGEARDPEPEERD